MTTTNNNNEIAATILSQIGKSALYMIGGKNYGAGKDNVSFKIGRNSKKITHIKITLNSMDLYDVEYIYIRGYNAPIIRATENGIYADMLRGSIERNTGLYTSL